MYTYIHTHTHTHTHTRIHRYLNEKSVAGVVQLDGHESEWDRLYFFPPGAFANMCITQKVIRLLLLMCSLSYLLLSSRRLRQHVHYPEGLIVLDTDYVDRDEIIGIDLDVCACMCMFNMSSSLSLGL